VLCSCEDKSVDPKGIELDLVESIPLIISEPSGISFNKDKSQLWIVGDRNPIIYLTDLRGNIETQFSVSKNDLEGISSIGDSIIVVVVERSREILFFSIKNNSESIIKTGLKGETNNGLEGITYIPDTHKIYISNEKNPKIILKLDLDGNIFYNSQIDYSKDIAGLYYDQTDDILWILSQESNKIFKCKTDLQILERYSVPNKKYEGIAVKENLIYLVSDTGQSLNIYIIP